MAYPIEENIYKKASPYEVFAAGKMTGYYGSTWWSNQWMDLVGKLVFISSKLINSNEMIESVSMSYWSFSVNIQRQWIGHMTKNLELKMSFIIMCFQNMSVVHR